MGDPPWPCTGCHPVTSWHGDNNNVTQSTAGDNGQINIKDNIPGDPGHSLEHTHTCKEDPDILKQSKKLNFPFLFFLSPDAALRCRPGHTLAATRSRDWASSCLRCHHDCLRSQSLWPPPSVSGDLHSPPWPWPACPHTPRYSRHCHRGNPVIRELSFEVSYFCMEGMCNLRKVLFFSNFHPSNQTAATERNWAFSCRIGWNHHVNEFNFSNYSLLTLVRFSI